MTKGRMGAVLLVLSIVAGLHYAMTAVSNDLSDYFPHLNAPPEEPDRTFLKKEPIAAVVQEMAPVSAMIPTAAPPRRETMFPVPSGLEEPVNFWKRVYGEFTSDQSVLHDSEDLSVIYRVLDFSYLTGMNISEKDKKELRGEREERAVERVQERLDQEAADRVRVQRGQSDKFREAVRVSGKYLPLFENIFVSYGLPEELPHLVFVESLFQGKARSKVGAVGLWQFMPGTAKDYLRVSRLIDERYDPIMATHAAAKVLRENYRDLGSWPLAITAYNAGARQMKRAVKKLGTRDIVRIIRRYEGGSFGFASRNFYPSFLAALGVAREVDRYFGPVEREGVLLFDVVSVSQPVSFSQIAFWSGATMEALEALNPSYAREVFLGSYLLPPGASVRIPAGFRPVFLTRLLQYPEAPPDLSAAMARIEIPKD